MALKVHLGSPLWVLVLMTIAIELLIYFNEL